MKQLLVSGVGSSSSPIKNDSRSGGGSRSSKSKMVGVGSTTSFNRFEVLREYNNNYGKFNKHKKNSSNAGSGGVGKQGQTVECKNHNHNHSSSSDEEGVKASWHDTATIASSSDETLPTTCTSTFTVSTKSATSVVDDGKVSALVERLQQTQLKQQQERLEQQEEQQLQTQHQRQRQEQPKRMTSSSSSSSMDTAAARLTTSAGERSTNLYGAGVGPASDNELTSMTTKFHQECTQSSLPSTSSNGGKETTAIASAASSDTIRRSSVDCDNGTMLKSNPTTTSDFGGSVRRHPSSVRRSTSYNGDYRSSSGNGGKTMVAAAADEDTELRNKMVKSLVSKRQLRETVKHISKQKVAAAERRERNQNEQHQQDLAAAERLKVKNTTMALPPQSQLSKHPQHKSQIQQQQLPSDKGGHPSSSFVVSFDPFYFDETNNGNDEDDEEEDDDDVDNIIPSEGDDSHEGDDNEEEDDEDDDDIFVDFIMENMKRQFISVGTSTTRIGVVQQRDAESIDRIPKNATRNQVHHDEEQKQEDQVIEPEDDSFETARESISNSTSSAASATLAESKEKVDDSDRELRHQETTQDSHNWHYQLQQQHLSLPAADAAADNNIFAVKTTGVNGSAIMKRIMELRCKANQGGNKDRDYDGDDVPTSPRVQSFSTPKNSSLSPAAVAVLTSNKKETTKGSFIHKTESCVGTTSKAIGNAATPNESTSPLSGNKDDPAETPSPTCLSSAKAQAAISSTIKQKLSLLNCVSNKNKLRCETHDVHDGTPEPAVPRKNQNQTLSLPAQPPSTEPVVETKSCMRLPNLSKNKTSKSVEISAPTAEPSEVQSKSCMKLPNLTKNITSRSVETSKNPIPTGQRTPPSHAHAAKGPPPDGEGTKPCWTIMKDHSTVPETNGNNRQGCWSPGNNDDDWPFAFEVAGSHNKNVLKKNKDGEVDVEKWKPFVPSADDSRIGDCSSNNRTGITVKHTNARSDQGKPLQEDVVVANTNKITMATSLPTKNIAFNKQYSQLVSSSVSVLTTDEAIADDGKSNLSPVRQQSEKKVNHREVAALERRKNCKKKSYDRILKELFQAEIVLDMMRMDQSPIRLRKKSSSRDASVSTSSESTVNSWSCSGATNEEEDEANAKPSPVDTPDEQDPEAEPNALTGKENSTTSSGVVSSCSKDTHRLMIDDFNHKSYRCGLPILNRNEEEVALEVAVELTLADHSKIMNGDKALAREKFAAAINVAKRLTRLGKWMKGKKKPAGNTKDDNVLRLPSNPNTPTRWLTTKKPVYDETSMPSLVVSTDSSFSTSGSPDRSFESNPAAGSLNDQLPCPSPHKEFIPHVRIPNIFCMADGRASGDEANGILDQETGEKEHDSDPDGTARRPNNRLLGCFVSSHSHSRCMTMDRKAKDTTIHADNNQSSIKNTPEFDDDYSDTRLCDFPIALRILVSIANGEACFGPGSSKNVDDRVGSSFPPVEQPPDEQIKIVDVVEKERLEKLDKSSKVKLVAKSIARWRPKRLKAKMLSKKSLRNVSLIEHQPTTTAEKSSSPTRTPTEEKPVNITVTTKDTTAKRVRPRVRFSNIVSMLQLERVESEHEDGDDDVSLNQLDHRDNNKFSEMEMNHRPSSSRPRSSMPESNILDSVPLPKSVRNHCDAINWLANHVMEDDYSVSSQDESPKKDDACRRRHEEARRRTSNVPLHGPDDTFLDQCLLNDELCTPSEEVGTTDTFEEGDSYSNSYGDYYGEI